MNRGLMLMLMLMLTLIVSAVTMGCISDPGRQSPPAPRVFTAAQARAGKVAYQSSCGLCHQFNLQGRTGEPGELPAINTLPENMIKTIDENGEQVPPLVGPHFMGHWGAKSTQDYVARVASAMSAFPPQHVDSATPVELTAYFLQMNGGKPGRIPLGADNHATLYAVTGHAAP